MTRRRQQRRISLLGWFTPIVLLLLNCWIVVVRVDASSWKECLSTTDGGADGGVCPKYATCCPSPHNDNEGRGRSSAMCIPTRHGKDPDDQGTCCDATTACPYGFSCAAAVGQNSTYHSLYCKIDQDNPPQDLYHDQPRYQMCQIPFRNMTTLYGLPMIPPGGNSNNRSSSSNPNNDSSNPQLAYYSNMGDITNLLTSKNNNNNNNQTSVVRHALIMIHGSGRTAEDYFCVALSLIPDNNNVLVVAPKFLAPGDDEANQSSFLIWQDHPDDMDHPLSHSWRYGANALNGGLNDHISSFDALDRLVETISLLLRPPMPSNSNTSSSTTTTTSTIAVAGHSAGGQFVHRWALLSNSSIWQNNNKNQKTKIRVIAANPRSYCYLDGRRILKTTNSTTTSFEVPSNDTIANCPNYNYWNWGLQQGGNVYTPYKDRALEITPQKEMAIRYGTNRTVVYLTGAYDVLPQDDHCATYELQGTNRHERALHYFEALKRYFNVSNKDDDNDKSFVLKHELHTVPESPHDHLLM
eukprot:scaffold146_cov107-Cylindrotheca_fusiformis.AAC.2